MRRSIGVAVTVLAACAASGQDVQPLEAVVVTATRAAETLRDVPAAVAVKEMETLRRDGFTYGSDEFRGVPGVFFRRGEGDGDEFLFVSMRGSIGTDGYLMLLDGVPYIGPDEEPLLTQVPYEAVERVEIVKGPSSALYGRGALYGVVNYITRSPRSDDMSVQVAAGSDDYYRVQGSLSRRLGSDSGFALSLAYEDYEGWREHSAKRVMNALVRYDVALSDSTHLEAFVNHSDRLSEVPNGLPVAFDGTVIPVAGGPEAFLGFGNPRNDLQATIASITLRHDPRDNLRVRATVQARRFDQSLGLNFYDPFGFDPSTFTYGINGFRSEGKHDVYYAEATVDWRAGRHHVIAGVGGERSKARDLDLWSGEFGFTPECGFNFFLIRIDYRTGQIVNRDAPCFQIDVPFTKDRFTNTFAGAFIQDEIALSERWSLTLGGRYDSFRREARFDPLPASTEGGRLSGDADAFSPKAALSYIYVRGHAYLSYGRGFNSNFGSTFEWDAAQYARPENKPTTLDSIELGWKGSLIERLLDAELALFHTTQKNRRSIVPNPAAEANPFAPDNLITYGDEYESKGAELSLRWQPRTGTALTASYTYLDPEWKEFVLSTFAGPVDLSGNRPVGVPRTMFYVAADHQLTSWLSARATFESYDDYMITQDNRIEGGGFELLNLGAQIAPVAWRNTRVDLTLTNVLDEEYYYFFGGRTAPTTANPGVPRQLRLAIRSSF